MAPSIGWMRVRSEFLAARRGRRLNGPHFFIEALDRGDEEAARLGLTVTRKVGNSVERNRIRRRLREAVRTGGGEAMATGFDYVIVARRDVLDAPFAVLKSELSKRFAKTGRDRSPMSADRHTGVAKLDERLPSPG